MKLELTRVLAGALLGLFSLSAVAAAVLPASAPGNMLQEGVDFPRQVNAGGETAFPQDEYTND